jgi:hypothetical protein
MNKSLAIKILALGILVGGSLVYIVMYGNDIDIPLENNMTASKANAALTKLDCKPSTKIGYDGHEVEEGSPTVGLIIDFGAKTFSRYDSKGQDTYKGVFNESGYYTNIQADTPSGMMIKIQTDRLTNNDPGYLDYLEVVTTGLYSLISYGKCTPI